MIKLKIEGMTCGHCIKADTLVSNIEEAGYEARVA